MCLLLYVTILNSPKNSSSPQTQVYILEWKCKNNKKYLPFFYILEYNIDDILDI